MEEEILKIYRRKFNDKELFSHLIERIELHMDKLRKLKEDKEKRETFLREIADVYLLSRVLLKLEKVSEETIEKSSEYYMKKIDELFQTN
ncbi:MAG TPA: hypothetical protein ENG87_05190 [Candidatus Pacearchaeota archaeon]|nr:hypothetical protein BMS3Abin17_00838 [archaeon BMS3Abin17]HDK42752.1 hypothetical protein [Candidatus Pacearchaeota archaeon]HDZ60721.1 hypothetical protein [Candidatus Pacearchaeota archaeon]